LPHFWPRFLLAIICHTASCSHVYSVAITIAIAIAIALAIPSEPGWKPLAPLEPHLQR